MAGVDVRDDPRYARLLGITRAMAAEGYDAVSMRAVAREARMSLATIYQFVSSKDQLIAEAHASAMNRFSADVGRRPPKGATAEKRVHAFFRLVAAPLEQDEVRTRTLMRALYSADPAVAASRASTSDGFRSAVDRAIGDDDVPDRAAVIETLGLVLHGVILSWLTGGYDARAARRALDNAVRVAFQRASTGD